MSNITISGHECIDLVEYRKLLIGMTVAVEHGVGLLVRSSDGEPVYYKPVEVHIHLSHEHCIYLMCDRAN